MSLLLAPEVAPAGSPAVDRLLSEGLAGLIQYCYSAEDSSLRLISRAGAALTGTDPTFTAVVVLTVGTFAALQFIHKIGGRP